MIPFLTRTFAIIKDDIISPYETNLSISEGDNFFPEINSDNLANSLSRYLTEDSSKDRSFINLRCICLTEEIISFLSFFLASGRESNFSVTPEIADTTKIGCFFKFFLTISIIVKISLFLAIDVPPNLATNMRSIIPYS